LKLTHGYHESRKDQEINEWSEGPWLVRVRYLKGPVIRKERTPCKFLKEKPVGGPGRAVGQFKRKTTSPSSFLFRIHNQARGKRAANKTDEAL